VLAFSQELGTAGVGRVAGAGAPGVDRDPASTHVRASSAVGRDDYFVKAAVQQRLVICSPLMLSANGSGGDVSGPQQRFSFPWNVSDAEHRPVGQAESGAADGVDIALVQFGGSRFHVQVGHAQAMEFEGELNQTCCRARSCRLAGTGEPTATT
jgi:hypothetical protein